MQYLTHPSLRPEYQEDIFETLVRQCQNDDLTLALAYYHTVQPTIKSPRVVESLFSALARTSVVEAFYFSRVQADVTRRRMFEMLVTMAIHGPRGEKLAARGSELVNLPFTQEEESWFEQYLTQGEGSKLKGAKDTLLMRRIGTGKFTEALALDFGGGKMSGGLSWELMQDGLQDGLGPRVDI